MVVDMGLLVAKDLLVVCYNWFLYMEVEEDNNLVQRKDNLGLNKVENNLVLHKAEANNVVQYKVEYYYN